MDNPESATGEQHGIENSKDWRHIHAWRGTVDTYWQPNSWEPFSLVLPWQTLLAWETLSTHKGESRG